MRASIIGAGVTGLAAGMVSGVPVFEQADGPGGICRSYYMRAGEAGRFDHAPPEDDAYRFEVGGGHWLFGHDEAVLRRIEQLAPLERYERRAAIRVGGATVPYPLQAHTEYLGPELHEQIVSERAGSGLVPGETGTLREWLERSFGPTLCELFFFPFHDRYTAGLTAVVAPQDEYKSPPAPTAHATSAELGYNATFRYPLGGLDGVVASMAERCDVRYHKRLMAFDRHRRLLCFDDGTEQTYETVVSTLPLHRAVELAGIELAEVPDPFTSVLVLNIGAEQGATCPDVHWQYEPDAKSGFHRIGFYSNVDRSFLPRNCRESDRGVALYVERAFLAGAALSLDEVTGYSATVVAELQDRDYIGEVHAIDPSWVEVAYTWQLPGSTWREQAIAALAADGIHQAGRYGRWHFQGIADSVREGLEVGERLVTARTWSNTA